MRPEDVPAEWARQFMAALIETGKRCEVNTGALYAALAAVAPIIAAAERERCAREVDCGCLNREAVLSAETKADRWRACPRDPCGAVEAAAIRALDAPAFVVATVEPDGSIKMRHEGDV